MSGRVFRLKNEKRNVSRPFRTVLDTFLSRASPETLELTLIKNLENHITLYNTGLLGLASFSNGAICMFRMYVPSYTSLGM